MADEITVDEPEADTATTEEAEMFPREVVEELRRENAKWRERTQASEKRLHTALVKATGRLADASDLPYSADHLDDPDKLSTAINSLLESKPHLASRKPSPGDIGQGSRGDSKPTDFSGLFR
ncbi:hypothetical protein [Mycobacterium arosiense]|uniref:hypothetical protein n=1 Tax=Mycobacterium arosiense TaxID=425468 RepID=UPI0009F3FD8B|nr:hypothetical protein [Mycobacterium arosiense]